MTVKWTKFKDEKPASTIRMFVKFKDGSIGIAYYDLMYDEVSPSGVEFELSWDCNCGSGECVFYDDPIAWARIPDEMTEVLND